MKTCFILLLSAITMAAAEGAPKAEQDVLAAMDAWKQGMLKRDATALGKLYHPDLTYSHSSGKTETKAEAIEASTKGKSVTESIEMSDIKVRVYGKTALVKGILDIRTNPGTAPVTNHLSILHVWIGTPQGWQMVARQATRLTP